nr:hypothetical protein [Tanacetum cinerariifolium]
MESVEKIIKSKSNQSKPGTDLERARKTKDASTNDDDDEDMKYHENKNKMVTETTDESCLRKRKPAIRSVSESDVDEAIDESN